MPKIYGKVSLYGRGRGVCKVCGYNWELSQSEYDELALNKHKISCLYCRAMAGLRVGEILPNNKHYMLASRIKDVNSPSQLRGNNYETLKVSIIHRRCNYKFEVSLGAMRRGDVRCSKCFGDNKQKELKTQPSNSSIKLIQHPKHSIKQASTNRLPLNNSENSISKIGDIYYNQMRVMEVNEADGTIVIQCIICGCEETKSISLLKKPGANREKITKCSICSKKQRTASELSKEYVGKVYNGLRVESVYTDPLTNATLCDTICTHNQSSSNFTQYITRLRSKDSLNEITYKEAEELHIQRGIPIGDVINHRTYCEACSKLSISEIYRMKPFLTCPNRQIGSTINTDNISLKDFYKGLSDKTLCSNCSCKSTCRARNIDPRTHYKFIASTLDIQDSLINDMLSIQSDYPNMFNFKDSEASGVDIKGELYIIRPAYIGRNGKMYYNCKCSIHNTELVLTDDEISSFNHNMCIHREEFMKFFDIHRQIYIKI